MAGTSIQGEEDQKYDASVEHLDSVPSVRGVKKPLKTPEERQADLDEALKADPGINPWSAAQFQVCIVSIYVICADF